MADPVGLGKARGPEARLADLGKDSNKQEGRGHLPSCKQNRVREGALWSKVRSICRENKEQLARVTQGENGEKMESVEIKRVIKLKFKFISKYEVIEPKIFFPISLWLPGSSKPQFIFICNRFAQPSFNLVGTRVDARSQAAPTSHEEYKIQV